jgi:outer membrane protein OmpA-like peptidoglycan-associated protein
VTPIGRAPPPKATVIITGYASGSGSTAANTQLAQKRAQAVAVFLEAPGVSPRSTVVEETVSPDGRNGVAIILSGFLSG